MIASSTTDRVEPATHLDAVQATNRFISRGVTEQRGRSFGDNTIKRQPSLAAAVETEGAAERTLDITRQQEQLEQVNYQTLPAADETYQQALISSAQARATRLGDTAALFQSLGGGWWNRSQSD